MQTFNARQTGREPASDGERLLCDLFAKVLDVDQIGPDDSFFDRGGHARLAATLLTRLRQRLGVEISLETFLDNPSASGIAHHVIAAATSSSDFITLPPERTER